MSTYHIGTHNSKERPRETNRNPSLNHPTNILRTKQRSPNQNQRDNPILKGTISRFQAQYNIQERNPIYFRTQKI